MPDELNNIFLILYWRSDFPKDLFTHLQCLGYIAIEFNNPDWFLRTLARFPKSIAAAYITPHPKHHEVYTKAKRISGPFVIYSDPPHIPSVSVTSIGLCWLHETVDGRDRFRMFASRDAAIQYLRNAERLRLESCEEYERRRKESK